LIVRGAAAATQSEL